MIGHADFQGLLSEALTRLLDLKQINDYTRVTTQCMYPSNGLVAVAVRLGAETVKVTDEGGAVREAISAGIDKIPSDRRLSRFVTDHGMSIKNGVISAPPVPVDQAVVAIMLVANISKEVATFIYRDAKIGRPRDLKQELTLALSQTFKDRLVRNDEIIGKHKRHRFANVIHLPNGRRLIVDPVQPDPNSINTRIASHLDIKKAENSAIDQRIVYDEEDDWSPDDLSLLQIADVPLIPFSKSQNVLQRIANALH